MALERGMEGAGGGEPRGGASLEPPSPSPLQAAGQASLTSLHIPYATINTSYFSPATLHRVLPPQPLPRWAPLPSQSPVPWAPLPASTRSSFISVENRLYAQAEKGPLHAGTDLIPLPDCLGRRAMEGR